MDIIEVEIINWAKHQPRKDIKHPSWFAMSNRVLDDVKLFNLTDSEWKAFIYLFSQASQQNTATPTINLVHALQINRIEKAVILSTLKKLAYADVTRTLRARTRSVRERTATHTHTNTHTPEDPALPRLACLWNELADSCMPRIRELEPGTKRGKDCVARWNEKPDEDYWREVIQKINSSKFCKGNGKKGWVANFAWMVRKGKAAEILEGNFGFEPAKVIL